MGQGRDNIRSCLLIDDRGGGVMRNMNVLMMNAVYYEVVLYVVLNIQPSICVEIVDVSGHHSVDEVINQNGVLV